MTLISHICGVATDALLAAPLDATPWLGGALVSPPLLRKESGLFPSQGGSLSLLLCLFPTISMTWCSSGKSITVIAS